MAILTLKICLAGRPQADRCKLTSPLSTTTNLKAASWAAMAACGPAERQTDRPLRAESVSKLGLIARPPFLPHLTGSYCETGKVSDELAPECHV
jgi:hypothetical protein